MCLLCTSNCSAVVTPLVVRSAVNETCTESGEDDVVALLQVTLVIPQSQRNCGSTCIAITLYVHNYLLERKIDALSNSLDDAEVSLVRDNPVDIFCSHLVALEHFLDVVAHVGNGVAEHGASLLIEVMQTVVHCEV